jgi:putative ABC transport system permease protein
MAVFALSRESERAFTAGPLGFDAVVGARGSALQLVLNAVYHLETSPGNVPWRLYEELQADRRVRRAVPFAVGDSYRGWRVVGTTPELFSAPLQAQGGPSYEVRAGGRLFDPARRELVAGATAARRLELREGDVIRPAHGAGQRSGSAGQEEHEEEYLVVGVLRPTGTPSDRVLWIPIEGVFRMGGHVLRGAGEEYQAEVGHEIPAEHKEVSAVLLALQGPQAGFQLEQELNREGREATIAWPIGRSMAELFEKLGWVNRVLELVAYLVLAVAAGTILASLSNTLNERRREFALLRALGAARREVFAILWIEAGTLAFLGSLAGYAVCALILLAARSIVQREIGIVLDVWQPHAALLLAPAGACLLGAAAGLLPAWKAYRTDVAQSLVPVS